MFKNSSKNILLGLFIILFLFMGGEVKAQGGAEGEACEAYSGQSGYTPAQGNCQDGLLCVHSPNHFYTMFIPYQGVCSPWPPLEEEEEESTPSFQHTRPVLQNPLGDATVPIVIGRVIDAVLGLVGSLALIMFIYGGLIWMTAGGNEQKVTKGKNIVIWAALGLVVVFSAYALVKFVFSALGV